jgi:hypothetical protein
LKAYLSLTCKPGAIQEVVKKLLFRLYIDPQNIFLLDNSADVLIQFNQLGSLEHFITDWFNPVRTVGLQEDLFSKIQSYVVLSEGGYPRQKPYAFVFINAPIENTEVVRDKLLRIPQVISADCTLGPYNVIGSVKANESRDCKCVVSTIEHIPEIYNYTTALVDNTELFPEW